MDSHCLFRERETLGIVVQEVQEQLSCCRRGEGTVRCLLCSQML